MDLTHATVCILKNFIGLGGLVIHKSFIGLDQVILWAVVGVRNEGILESLGIHKSQGNRRSLDKLKSFRIGRQLGILGSLVGLIQIAEFPTECKLHIVLICRLDAIMQNDETLRASSGHQTASLSFHLGLFLLACSSDTLNHRPSVHGDCKSCRWTCS